MEQLVEVVQSFKAKLGVDHHNTLATIYTDIPAWRSDVIALSVGGKLAAPDKR